MILEKRLVSPLVLTFLLFQSLTACKYEDLSRPLIVPKASGSVSGETGASADTVAVTPPAGTVPAASGDAGTVAGADGTAASGADTGPAAPATGTVAALDATGGTGGQTGDLTSKSASGLNFIMNAPDDVHTSGKAYGVLVLLHGSTASNYKQFVPMMADVAKEHDLIRVSVLAPNGQGWNEGGEVAAADALHDLVQKEILAKYNVDKKKVLFSGQSSGGGFLSTNFIPQHAKDYTGGAFLQCGAAPPAKSLAFKADDATKANFKMHFEITTGDPIWPVFYAQALQFYGAAGMQFSKDDTKPGGHCAFDQQQVIKDHLDFILGTTTPAP